MKRVVPNLIRIGICLFLIGALVRRSDTGEMLNAFRFALSHGFWLAAGVAFFLGSIYAGLLRWKVLLEPQDLAPSHKRLWQIYFIGQFFNVFMFGSTGGDLVRAYYAARETHHRKAETAVTVLMDRLIGLIVLVVIALGVLTIRYDFFLRHPETHLPCLLLLAMAGLLILGLGLAPSLRKLPLTPLLTRFPVWSRRLRQLYLSMLYFPFRSRLLLKTVLASLCLHVLVFAACYCLGKSLGLPLVFTDYLTILPIIMTLSSLPITPGGLGVRESLFVVLMHPLGIPLEQALPLSLLVYFAGLLSGLVGGVVFLVYSGGTGHTVRRELAELRHESLSEDG